MHCVYSPCALNEINIVLSRLLFDLKKTNDILCHFIVPILFRGVLDPDPDRMGPHLFWSARS
jgi:hypothetical protein